MKGFKTYLNEGTENEYYVVLKKDGTPRSMALLNKEEADDRIKSGQTVAKVVFGKPILDINIVGQKNASMSVHQKIIKILRDKSNGDLRKIDGYGDLRYVAELPKAIMVKLFGSKVTTDRIQWIGYRPSIENGSCVIHGSIITKITMTLEEFYNKLKGIED
jgi:hypothetical protein